MAVWRLHRLSFRRRNLAVAAVSCAAVLITLMAGLMWPRAARAFDPSLQPAPGDPDLTHWPHYLELPLPPLETGAKWIGAVIPPPVFGKARLDLGDLRLFDRAGHEVPYAMRILEPKSVDQEFPCREFNRAMAPDKASELTLDLGAEPPEHNEVDVRLPGADFRRRALLDASPDGGDWRKLLERQLFYFRSGDRELRDLRLAYPPSRFRYRRLRIEMDPAVDKEAVDIEAATVHHRVEVPGESVSYNGA